MLLFTDGGVGLLACLQSNESMWESELVNNARILLVVVAVALFSCSSGRSAREPGSCQPALTEAEPILGAEARAHATDDLEVWALFFNTWPLPAGEAVRIPVDEEVKIVWRSTGEGSFAIEVRGPDGASIEPTWGPAPHGNSNWSRPGDEWGTGWVLPSSGCWTFEVTRGGRTASLDAEVFAPSAA